MKKTVSLLLCLALFLSFAPLGSLADGAPGTMYTGWDEQNRPSGEAVTPGTVLGEPGYVIPESAGGKAYFVCDAGTEPSFSNGLATGWEREVGGNKVFELIPYNGYYNHGELRIKNSDGSETIYFVQFEGQTPIAPELPEGAALYTDAELSVKADYVNLNEELNEDVCGVWGYSVSADAAYFTCPDGWSCLEQNWNGGALIEMEKVETSDDGSAVYKLVPGESYSDRGDFRLENEEGGGMSITVIFENFDPEVLLPAHEITDGERAQGLDEDEYGPVSFELDGTAYYMGIISLGSSQPANLETITANEGSSKGYVVSVWFWTRDESGYIPVSSDTAGAILERLGDDIDIELYAESESCKTFPEERRTSQNDGLAARCWIFTGLEYAGNWQLRAVWRPEGGGTLTSYVRFGWEAKNTVESEPMTSVEAVNEWLVSEFAKYGEGMNYWVHLAPGELSGIISIPNGMSFSIIGSGVDETVLNGGVYIGSGGHGGIHGLTMSGAGSQHKRWPQLYVNGEKAPNYGIFGSPSAAAAFYDTVFEDYYYAVYNGDGLGSDGPGQGSVFRNNHVGLCIDAAGGVGGLTGMLTDALFENNDIAIELLSFHTDVAPRSYNVTGCRFINNDTDVYNESGRNFFLPYNCFYHEGSGCIMVSDSKNPGKDKKDNRNLVSADPILAEDMQTEIYADDMALSNSLEYFIPLSELGGRDILVIENGDTEDTPLLSFSFPDAAYSSDGGSAASRSDEGFNPRVELVRGGDELTLTINDVPGGMTPTVTVYCDGWANAVVSFEGKTLRSSFADEAVSFDAAEGGTYVIEKAAAPQNPSGPAIRPNEPDDGQPETDETDFTDVPEDSYYAAAVAWAVKNGVTEGTGEHSFSPEAECTRAQVITFLWRALNCPEAGAASGFDDVAGDEYYAAAVAWALENGVTTGAAEHSFAPDSAVTRAQFVVMLYRAAGEPETELTDEFDDVSPEAYYAAAVAWAVKNGVTEGTGERSFSPDAICTRAQTVTFMYRAAEILSSLSA